MAKQTFTTGQVLTAAQMTDLQQTAMTGGAASTKTVSYVLVAADAGTRVAMNAAGSTTITVNTGLFSAGDTVSIQNIGAGVCTVTAGTATVNTSGSLVLAQYQGGILYFTSASAAIFFQFATPASGDIEGVTAGVGISGGGTSGTVTITNSMATAIDAKGDLVPGTGADTFSRLAVGANGTVLTADSAEATGLKWATPSGSASYTLINSGGTTISGNTTISSIGGYTHLFFLLEGVGRSSGSGSSLGIRFNGDTGANYNWAAFGSFNSGTASSCGFEKAGGFIQIAFRYGSNTNFNNGNFGAGWVYRYGSSDDKAVTVFMNGTDGAPNTTPFLVHTSAAYNSSSAITSITIMADQTLDTGKIYVYGVN